MRLPIRLLAPLVVVAAATAVLLTGPGEKPAPTVQAAPIPGQLPVDLALIPNEAIGFVHVRVADIWKHEGMKDTRKFIEKAGPKAIGILDKDFIPAPTTTERITTVVMPAQGQSTPGFVTIIAFSAPFEADQVRKRYLPKEDSVKVGQKTFYADKSANIALYFPDNSHVVLSDPEAMKHYLALTFKAGGPLKSAIDEAQTKPMTACLNVAAIPNLDKMAKELPQEFHPLLKAERLLITADIQKEVTLNLRASFANADAATSGDKALRKALELARGQLSKPRDEVQQLLEGKKKDKPRDLEELPQAVGGIVALAGLNLVDELLADPPIKQDGDSLKMSVTLPAWTTPILGSAMLSAAVALPLTQKVREAASRAAASNNLKQIGLAMHNYHDAVGSLPPAAILDKNGKKLLSWRVAILPYIEQGALYEKFKLDEPWDSENNKPLSATVVKIYNDPRINEPASNKTYYKLFVGKDTAFDWAKSRTLVQITDGTSNTIMVAAAGEPVEWAKPEDFEFDPEKKLPDLTKPFRTLLVAFCDGSVRSLNTDMKDFETVMKAAITAAGGEVFTFDD